MLSTSVFNSRPALEASFKITSLDYCDSRLYVGDENGVVRKFTVKTEQENIIPNPKDVPMYKLPKGKVQALKHLQYVNQILVQADKQLLLLDGESLIVRQEIVTQAQKDCEIFAIDEDPRTYETSLARLLVCKSDTKIAFYDYDNGGFVFRTETTKLGSKPTSIAWFGKNIFIGFDKKSYQVLDFQEKKQKDIQDFKELVLVKHAIKIVSEEETLLLGPSDFFIPISSTRCDKLDQNPIQAMTKLIGISVLDPYIIMLGENKIQVFNKTFIKNRSRLLQEIPLESGASNQGRAVSVTSNKVFYATTSKIYFLSPVPYDLQISKCLRDSRVEDAFMIFDQYVGETDPDRQKKYDSLKIDAAWIYLHDLKFREAESIIQDLNYDIKEFLALFLSYIPIEKLFDSKNVPTISLYIEDAKKRPTADTDLKNNPNKAINSAREFLGKILENRRRYLEENYKKNLKEVPEFLSSQQFSPFREEVRTNRVVKLTVEEHLEIIEYALINVYLDLGREDQLNALLSKKLYCNTYYNDLERHFENRNISDAVRAKFFEQFGKYKDALNVWTEALHQVEPHKVNKACEEMIRILTTHTTYFKEAKEKNVIFDYLEKILIKNPSFARSFFLQINDKLISPDRIEGFLTNRLGNLSHLKEIFYEVLVNEKKIEDERFHTTLATHYVNSIFQQRTRDQPIPNEKNPLPKDAKLNDYLKKFQNFLRDPSARYSREAVLSLIKDSWLLDDEIYLYGIIKNHNEALRKLLSKGLYEKAERYCAEKNEFLLTKLFEHYIGKYNEYNELLKQNNKDASEITAKRDAVVKTIHIFLKKYSAHPQLDAAAVIEKIPDEWDLWEKKSESGVYSFLFYALSSTLHAKRNAKVAKYLSELDSLDTQYKLLKAQSAHVTITNNRRCAMCNKAIGRAVFVVYPNGVIAHHICSQDKLTVCPVTKQNFEKTFSG